MKHLMLILLLVVPFINIKAQYCYEHYIYDHYVYDGSYRVAPVHVKVRKTPKVVVIEEEENVVYYHKRKKPNITHIYERDYTLNNNEDEIITLDNINSDISYCSMWKQTIWFNEDSYKINKVYNKVTLDNVASFLKTNNDSYITIYGYASKKHGSYEYNKNLSAERCVNTKRYLMEVYGINSNRIKICVRGTDTPEYYVDKWNQCVIIKCDNIYE